MRLHADFFKLFLEVPPSGGGKKAAKKSAAPATEASLDAAFEQHLTRMSRSGVYGDNLELTAFARAYACDVKIYQREFAYVISCADFQSAGDTDESRENFLASAPEGVGMRDKPQVCHIAYHTWEHYSSVRNLAGPWTGLPLVQPKETDVEKLAAGKKKIKEQGLVMPWMLKAVRESLPWGEWGDEEIGDMLEKCKGDVGEAVGRFLEKAEGVDAEGEVDQDAGGDERAKTEEEAKPSQPESPPKLTKAAAKKQARQALLAGGAKHKAVAESVAASTAANTTTDKKKDDSSAKNTNKKGKAAIAPAATKKAHPKKETPRERKERQKAEAQARKKGTDGGSSGGKGADNKSGSNGVDTASGGIRELYI